MASGLNAEKFTFNGYLPRKGNKRVQVLRRLVNMVKEDKGTQIFIEAPYRNQAMFNDIIKLDKNIYLCLAENIGSKEKSIVTKPIKEWREDKKVFKKNPTIYLIGKSNEEF
jgi:16S rRNA (cytidine1402-2'-O)-methyltransferase